MSLAGLLIEAKPTAAGRAMIAMTVAALGCAAAGAGAAIEPVPPKLTIDQAVVRFPGGRPIPGNVPNSAGGGLSPDGYSAKFTGMIGPITRDAFLFNAPMGGEFHFEGDIVGGVFPGLKICVSYQIAVAFTGGKVNWGTDADIFAPNAGVFHSSSSAQLTDDGILTNQIEYEFNDSTPQTGSFKFDFAFNWVSAHESDTLTIEVQTLSVEVCSVPAPGAVVLAGLGMGMAIGRRRR